MRVCWRSIAQQLHRFPGGRLGHATQPIRVHARVRTGPTRLDPGLPRGYCKGEGQQIFRRRCVYPSPSSANLNLRACFALLRSVLASLVLIFFIRALFFSTSPTIDEVFGSHHLMPDSRTSVPLRCFRRPRARRSRRGKDGVSDAAYPFFSRASPPPRHFVPVVLAEFTARSLRVLRACIFCIKLSLSIIMVFLGVFWFRHWHFFLFFLCVFVCVFV